MIIIEKLGPISLFLSVFLRLLGFQVRYFDMSSVFRNKKAVDILKKLGIVWMNYYDFPKEVMFDEERETLKEARVEIKKITETGLYQDLIGNSPKFEMALLKSLTSFDFGIRGRTKTRLFVENMKGKNKLISFRTINFITFLLDICYNRTKRI